MVSQIENIVAALGGKQSGSGYIARCPMHDDRHPSLSLSESNAGKLLLYCQAGCDSKELIEHLRSRNLWTSRETSKTPATCKIYRYEDELGNLVFEKVRLEPKAFFQRRPDGNGGYTNDLDGIDTSLLYRLPELVRGIRLQQTIFIAEGEKDCDTLAAHGCVATCNTQGASKSGQKPKWDDNHVKWLGGAKEIIVLPDNDDAGKTHGLAVAASLYRHQIPVRILQLPELEEKGDVTDWFTCGGTAQKLVELCSQVPPWTPLPAMQSEVIESLIDWTRRETFGDPILFGEIETPEITTEFLPYWVRDYVDALAANTQTPAGVGAMLVLAVLAACIQKRFEVSPKGDDYNEPLSIWVLIALPPASRKTALLHALIEPVIEWEREELKRLQPSIERQQAERAVDAERIKELTRQAGKTDPVLDQGSNNKRAEPTMTRQQILDEILKLKEKLREEELHAPKVFATDVTPEAAQNGLAEQGERLAIMTDEGNLFDILSGMYTNGKQNLDVFLQGHAGGPLRVKRGNRNVDLNKIALSIGLAVQPAVLSEQTESDRRKFRGKGLFARFLACLPKSNIGKRDVRLGQPIPIEVKQAYKAGVKALLNIRPQFNEHGVEYPRLLKLERGAALEAFQRFAQYIETHQGEGAKFERLQDFTGKLPGAALRIAGVCHVTAIVGSELGSLSSSSALSNGNTLEINQQIIEPVLDLSEKLIVHAQAVFDLIGDDAVVADAKHALKLTLAKAERNESGAFFVRQNVLHTSPRFKNSKLDRLLKALDILRERNIISTQQNLPTRKPTYVYFVNPAIFEGAA